MRRLPHGAARASRILLLLLCVKVGLPENGSAQRFIEMVSACGAGGGTMTVLCHNAALAIQAGRAGLATAATSGSEVPGSASTLGYRLRGFPRFALGARAGIARFSMVDPDRGYTPPSPAGADGLTVPSLHLSGTLGVLNGFSPAPTVGGVLSLDVMASIHGLFLPDSRGFQEGLLGWGVGARLGLLRESFTLPGISLSVARRWMGTARMGDMEVGGAAEAAFDLDVTSLRAVLGKDIHGLGFIAGAGRNSLSGGGTVRARVSPTGPESMGSASRLTSKQMVYFGGVSMTFLILQVSGELGWSDARDLELPRAPGGDSFPSSSSYFGSLALRVTF